MNFNLDHENEDGDSNAECSLNTRRGKDITLWSFEIKRDRRKKQ